MIDDASFLHGKFQFRFTNFGRLSGGYDTWNLDYIYFNTAANRISDIPVDFGFASSVSPRLNTYTSIPARHFLSAIDSVWEDTLTVGIRSAFAQARNFRQVSLETEVYAPDSVAGSFSTFLNSQRSLDPLDTANYIFTHDKTLLSGLDVDSFALSYTFILDLLTQPSDVPITRANDTLKAMTIFSNYYAYDDGSAELGYGVSEKFGKIAYEYENLQEDTLRYVDIFLAQLGGQASGSFKVKVWESLDTLSGDDVELFSTTSYPILYTEGVNTFQRLTLDEYLPLPKGKFYIGIEQLSDQNIMLGFDKNMDSGDKIFYNLGAKWFQNKQFRGSLMLRPVFEFPSTVTGLEEDLAQLKQVIVYPNPSQQFFWLKGEVEQIALYTLSGIKILQETVNSKDNVRIDLPELSAGLYILKIQKGDAVLTQKVIIQQP